MLDLVQLITHDGNFSVSFLAGALSKWNEKMDPSSNAESLLSPWKVNKKKAAPLMALPSEEVECYIGFPL